VENLLLSLIILIEFVLVVTTSAPLFLANRFRKSPNLGIGVWFGLFFSAMIAGFISVGIAGFSILLTWRSLSTQESIWVILAGSIAPWLLLAFAGVLLALGNQKLEPMFQKRAEIDLLSQLAPREIMKFHKARVFELEVPGFYALSRNYDIYVSKAVFKLTQKQQEAILWHEYGHIRLGHQNLKRITNLVLQLSSWFAVSRGFAYEVAKLCELAADKYALKRVYSKDLYEARKLFS
jgi:Zn-dependent protease with chaperone function